MCGLQCTLWPQYQPSTPALQLLTFVLLFLLSFSGFLVSDIPIYFE